MNSSIAKAESQPGHRRSRSVAIAICLVVAAVAASGFYLRWKSNSKQSNQAIVRFVAGQRLTYNIEFESTSASNFGAVFADSSSALMSHLYEASIRGELQITVLEADTDHVSLAYEFRDPQIGFQSEGQDDPNEAQAIKASLEHPVFCLLDERDTVQSVRFDAATNLVAQQMVRTLLAATQVIGSASDADSGGQWEAEEEDPSGKLIAHYQMQPEGTIQKTKLRYLRPKLAKKTRTVELTPAVQSDEKEVVTLDRTRSLVALSDVEAQSMTLQDKMIGRGILKLEMSLQQTQECAANTLAILRTANAKRIKTGRSVSLYNPAPPEEVELAIQRQALGTATLESLLNDLAVAEKDSNQEEHFTPLCLKFKALAFVRPEECAALGQLLSRGRNRKLSDACRSRCTGICRQRPGASGSQHGDFYSRRRLARRASAHPSSRSDGITQPSNCRQSFGFGFGKYDKNS